MFREADTPDPVFTDTLELDLVHRGAEPRRTEAAAGPGAAEGCGVGVQGRADQEPRRAGERGRHVGRRSPARTTRSTHGDVVIAAITSCTNTSNPSVLVAAGLVARKARAKGLTPKPWVKTSLAPGSQVVTRLSGEVGAAGRSGRDRVQPGRLWLHHLHRQFRAAGRRRSSMRSRTTGWSPSPVLSGNRNFEGRVHPNVRANYLASPPLVVAYALLGKMTRGYHHRAARHRVGRQARVSARRLAEQQGDRRDHRAPASRASSSSPATARCSRGRSSGRRCRWTPTETYRWSDGSTYVKNPPYFEGITMEPPPVVDIKGARILARAGRFDHHRPHQPGRLDPQGLAGGRLPAGTPGAAEGLQQLRCAPRQP